MGAGTELRSESAEDAAVTEGILTVVDGSATKVGVVDIV